MENRLREVGDACWTSFKHSDWNAAIGGCQAIPVAEDMIYIATSGVVGNVTAVNRDDRFFGLVFRCYLRRNVRFEFNIGTSSQGRLLLELLGVDAHPLANAALRVSPFFPRSHHALTHGVCALVLAAAQIID